ncbi:hypothetical protein A5745_16540 [Mycobacterium sp. IS-2888]|uniref:hypothetical protein n=1 Tax=Mycobacterium sp. IS-2888 TaxID=1834159 RepID=UPI00096DC868|nr:hypothetical protein [Mycobacterium sp. IS-2888]OMC44678.1 hypothetical protein A5745_16540 [Mycobacterium sp. IS-2888]
MSISDQSATSRQFAASSGAFSPNWIRYWKVGYSAIFAVAVLFGGLQVLRVLKVIRLPSPHIGAPVIYGVVVGLLVVGVGFAARIFWRSRRKYLITVNSDGLAIDRRRGDVYPLVDAQLGLWLDNGVALHLQCGRRDFVLGGRDRRIGPATPLDAPPVWVVDAWLAESDFDELLLLGGRSAARGPAPGEPTRCLLFPNPLLIQEMGPFALVKKHRLTQSLSQPQLFIDVDNDTIQVIDPKTNAPNARASASQVTATPATYQLSAGHAFPSAQNVASDAAGQYFSTTPAMSVCVPGMQPLTIGCRNFEGLKRRFSWSANAPVTNEPPAYTVSAADWLTLTENLGLAPYLEDTST